MTEPRTVCIWRDQYDSETVLIGVRAGTKKERCSVCAKLYADELTDLTGLSVGDIPTGRVVNAEMTFELKG